MKISEFVMANEVKGIPVEMAKFTSSRACHIYALLKIVARHNVGL